MNTEHSDTFLFAARDKVDESALRWAISHGLGCDIGSVKIEYTNDRKYVRRKKDGYQYKIRVTDAIGRDSLKQEMKVILFSFSFGLSGKYPINGRYL